MKPYPLTKSNGERAAAVALTAGIEKEFPPGVAQPALRALARAGYRTLRDLRGVSESDLAKLHGIGPKSLRLIREALATRRSPG